MKKPIYIVAAAAFAGSLMAQEASAQQVKALGFKVGQKSRLHTNLDLMTIFDSNPKRRDPGNVVSPGVTEADGQDTWRLIARPNIFLDVPGKTLALTLGAGATINYSLESSGGNDSEGQYGFDVDLGLSLGNSRSKVSFELNNMLMKTPTILTDPGAIGADESLFPAFTNQGIAKLIFRPGGGALSISTGYKNNMLIFDRPQDNGAAPDDGQTHTAFVEARLKFLPKTDVFFWADAGLFIPTINRTGPLDQNVITKKSTPYHLELGLDGQITSRLKAEVRAGFGHNLVWNDDFFSQTYIAEQLTPVGTAMVEYEFGPKIKASLAYQRNVQPIVALNSMIYDAVRLRGEMGIDRLVGSVYVEYQARDFGTAVDGPNQQTGEPYTDLFMGGARVDYYFFDFLTGGVQGRMMVQKPNDDARQAALGTDARITPELGEFDRFQFMFNVGLKY